MKTDVIVLGAGVVGISTAIHLARRGKSVVLVDRRGPAEETSYGNAGLIQREGVFPYGFPHDFGALFRYALNNTIDAHYHLSALPGLVPFLLRYWWHSGFTQHQRIAHLYAPLIEHSVSEHADLIKASGAEALIRKDGWMKVFRTEKERDAAYADFLERLGSLLQRARADIGEAPQSIFLTGGSSRAPLIRAAVQQQFPQVRVVYGDPSLGVVSGLAAAAALAD